MFGKAMVRGVLAVALVCCAVVAQAVNIDLVPVGNPGNAGDTRYGTPGYGAVGYAYNMGKYEVTAAQYTEFLNAKAATDTYGLYNASMWSDAWGCKIQQSGGPGSYTYSVASDYANRPVNYVSWYDGIRFANWLQNGQGFGSTENGTYTITGGGPDWTVAIPDAATRATWTAANKHWVLPSEDEWYKAAYHKNDGATGNYWDYPTKSDAPPINTLLSPDPGNHANFYDSYGTGTHTFTIGGPYYRTEVGAFANSASAYGTFDQGGNVWEWNEALISSSRGLRGGSFSSGLDYPLLASARGYYDPPNEDYWIGFRVASVPEPGSIILVVSGAIAGLIWWRRRR
jgi:formylglycine-generating enzyme required for sulfatase activity